MAFLLKLAKKVTGGSNGTEEGHYPEETKYLFALSLIFHLFA